MTTLFWGPVLTDHDSDGKLLSQIETESQ